MFDFLFNFPRLLMWLHSLCNLSVRRLTYVTYLSEVAIITVASDEYVNCIRADGCNTEMTYLANTCIAMPVRTLRTVGNCKYVYHGPYYKGDYTVYYLDIYSKS